MKYKKNKDTINQCIIKHNAGLVLSDDGLWIGTKEHWNKAEEIEWLLEDMTENEINEILINKFKFV